MESRNRGFSDHQTCWLQLKQNGMFGEIENYFRENYSHVFINIMTNEHLTKYRIVLTVVIYSVANQQSLKSAPSCYYFYTTSPYGYPRWPPLILKDFECIIVKRNVNQSANKCIVVVVVVKNIETVHVNKAGK